MDPPPPPYSSPHLYPAAVTALSAAATITPATVEAHNYNIITTTHVAANPTPAPNPTPNHPPYAEMIYGAITALKEKDGSSKRAIAKYIERVYSGLPATHSALLTHHLKRLKNNGHLLMVKKSYKLPGSEGSVPPPPTSAADAAGTAAIPSPGLARGRGRPPKNKPISDQPNSQQPISQQFIPFPPQQQQQPIPILQLPTSQQPFPIPQQTNSYHQQPIPIPQQLNSNPIPAEPNSQPILVALGLADEPGSEKRRPGRPRKVVVGAGVGQAVGSPVSGKRGRGRPPGTRLPKKKAGRPPKPKSVSAVGGLNGLAKRGRGRPSKAEPKSVYFPYATNVPIIGAFEQNNVPNVVAPQQPQLGAKRRGRPSKKKEEAASAATVRVGGLVPGKRGRPPGLPGIERPSRKSGRPVGRPRKNALAEITEAPDPKSVANGEFKRKLEYFQFKVGQAVGALKPYLTPESAGNAIAAIQELEGLATMDINTPLDIEAQQPPMLQS
ncbi:hypothetical protein ACFX13_016180 [Malus domestica]|uniref:H15 domain-containing protein n=1 Tax=Malus domestica TaxID=3750 RepID=A0A498I5L9_MALDO|nr:hypothetical protein DVH24_023511 [Malus domestica]